MNDKQVNEILIYQTEDGSAVTMHLSNIFKSDELDKASVCSVLERTAASSTM